MKFDTDEKIAEGVRWKGLEPVGKFPFSKGEIYVADGKVSREEAKQWGMKEYPNGLYQTMWIWKQDKPILAHWVEFDPYHDFDKFGLDETKKRQGRINHVLGLAKDFISESGKPLDGS